MKIILALLISLNAFAGYVEVPPPSGGGGGTITDVNGQTGPSVVLTKSDVGLGSVDNTSDANKPVSTQQATAIGLKANSASISAIGFSGNLSDATNDINLVDQTALDLKLNSASASAIGLSGNADDLIFSPAVTNNSLAGFSATGKLQTLPTYNFIPYQNGIASSMTTDGSSQTNIEKLYFGTTFGDGVSGDIDNYTDLYFNNLTNANFNIDYYRSFASYFNAANNPVIGQVSLIDTGFGGDVTTDVKLYSSYYTGNNGANFYGLNLSKDGTSVGDVSQINLSTTGQAVNVYGLRNSTGGNATNQIEHISLYNNGTVGGNYFGVNDNNQGSITGQIYHFNASNQGSANSYTGANLSNSGSTTNYINGYNFYNGIGGVSPALTYFNAGNDANISGNFTGLNFTNQGTSTNHTGLAVSNGVSGSAVNYQGLSISQSADVSGSTNLANLYNDGDGVQTTGINVNINGNHTTSITGLSVSVNNATHPNTIQPIGLQVNGALNANSSLTTGTDPVNMASALNSIGGQFAVSNGNPLTGGEFVFGNNLAPVMAFSDDMNEDMTGLDLGFAAVGFVGSLGIGAGKTVADINMALAGAGNPSGSGVVDNMTMYYAAGILPQGGSVTANNMYGFKTSPVLCLVAGNCWGLNIKDTSAQNFLSRLAIGTSNEKVSSSDHALEVGNKGLIVLGKNSVAELGAKTTTEGAIAYNSDTGTIAVYNGAWADLGVAGAGVTSVNGNTGPAVTLDSDDISEGVTNLYYTNARFVADFDTEFAGKYTDGLSEGAINFYYTQARFDSSFATKDTDSLNEGAINKYYTATQAAVDLIAASISNGDLTHAPDGNSVFDALALKADDSSLTPVIPLNSSSLSLAGSGSISISLVKYKQKWIVESSGGAVTLSTTPFGSSAPLDGTQITLVGNSDTNTIKVTNNDIAKGLILNGDATLMNGQAIVVEYDATKDRYFQVGKNF